MVLPPTEAFLLPGPVKMHPRVIEAMAVRAMNHRGPEFKEALAEIFRIGHMGICSIEDIQVGFRAVEATRAAMSHRVKAGAAVQTVADRG